jgi:hypothetical protein
MTKTAPKATTIAATVAPYVTEEQMEQFLWLGGAVGQLYEEQQNPGELKHLRHDDPDSGEVVGWIDAVSSLAVSVR